jgi:hypothetical protein
MSTMIRIQTQIDTFFSFVRCAADTRSEFCANETSTRIRQGQAAATGQSATGGPPPEPVSEVDRDLSNTTDGLSGNQRHADRLASVNGSASGSLLPLFAPRSS